jgi:hypothetical protein
MQKQYKILKACGKFEDMITEQLYEVKIVKKRELF